MTENPFTILIADRNPHVREFLKREMASEGYRIRLAENGKDVLNYSYGPEPLDLLILDPDLPGGGAEDYIWPLLAKYPGLPVVFHCLSSDIPMPMPQMACTVIVEKSANSIDLLRRQIDLLLKTARQD